MDLFLHEECLLLALRDEKGTPAMGTSYRFAMGGAMLAELLLSGRAEIERDGKRNFLRLVSDTPFGDELLDECIEKVATSKRRQQLQTWVSRFGALRRIHTRVAEGLCEKGVLKVEKNQALLVIKWTVYPELDGRVEKRILERLGKVVFTETREVDPRTQILLSLANSTGLLKVNFDSKKLKQRKARIERVISGEAIGSAAKDTVEAATAALMASVIIPAVIVPTIVSS